jgi:hypothetical protein
MIVGCIFPRASTAARTDVGQLCITIILESAWAAYELWKIILLKTRLVYFWWVAPCFRAD